MTEYVTPDGDIIQRVRVPAPDACDYCRTGVSVGHDHPECETVEYVTPQQDAYGVLREAGYWVSPLGEGPTVLHLYGEGIPQGTYHAISVPRPPHVVRGTCLAVRRHDGWAVARESLPAVEASVRHAMEA